MSEMLAAANHFGDLGRFLRQYLHYEIGDPELMEIWKTEIDFIEWLSMEPCTISIDDYDQITCPNYRDGMCVL